MIDSLSAALDLPVVVHAKGMEIHVYAMRVNRIGEFSRACAPLAEQIKANDVLALLSDTRFAELVAVLTGVEAAWLMRQDAGVLAALYDAARLLNAPLFAEKESGKESGSGAEVDWFDLFQALVSAGHRQEDIGDYSVAQFSGYLQAARAGQGQQDKATAAWHALSARAAQSEARAFSTYLESLSG